MYWKDRITNDEILRRLHGVLEMVRKRHKEWKGRLEGWTMRESILVPLAFLCHWQYPWAEIVFKSPRSFIEEIGHKQHPD